MREDDAKHLTLVTALRLFLVFVATAALAYLAYFFGAEHILFAYLLAFSASVSALCLPPLVVLLVAAACRRPIDHLPTWFLISGTVFAMLGFGLLLVLHHDWTLWVFASGMWLLLVGAGAKVAIGLIDRWGL